MVKLDYNYHTHTYRCSHASGTAEEYILRAIEGGIKHMGFSEHAPFIFPDGNEQYYRLPVAQIGDYFGELYELRERYADRLDIKIGFEMEYYPTYFKDMLELTRKSGAEYLILGQHHVYDYPLLTSCMNPTDDPKMLLSYVNSTIEAMKTGVFSYVAHPDILNFTGDATLYRRHMLRLCEAAAQLDVPLEINFLGIRDDRNYPATRFWRLVGKTSAPVTFGFDAHDVQAAYDGSSYEKAMSIVELFHLNYIGKPTLRPI